MTTHRVPHQEQPGRFGSKWDRPLLVVLFILLIIVASLLSWQIYDSFSAAPLPTAAAEATLPGAATEPQTQIFPSAGRKGSLITVWGQGWQPEAELIVCLDDLGDDAEPPIMAETTANAAGEFSATFIFPVDVQWRSLPDIPVVVESKTGPEKASAVFKLLLDTPTPALPTPTATPLPSTPTAVPPSPTPACIYSMRYVADVTIPDDTVIPPGVGFVKTWRIRNSGTCAWPAGTQWVFAGGSQMSGPNAIPAPATNPGETADLSVYLIAPTTPGTCVGYWTLNLPGEGRLNPRYFVRIVVPAPTSTPTPTFTPLPPTSTPLPVTPTPIIYNWRGEYYDNTSLLNNPVLVRDDTAVNFYWGAGAPATNVPRDNFSVRWTRSLYFEGGTYRFYAYVDDGVRLWVDNRLILDQWHSASGQTYVAEETLTTGHHVVRVEYYEGLGLAQIQVWWQRETTYPDWYGEYWDNKSLSGPPALVRNDAKIDFNWELGAPAPGLPDEQFSARWTRTIDFVAGTYRLNARADDGVRVFVDGERVMNHWELSSGNRTHQKELSLSGVHTLVVEYYEETIGAEVHFWYERIGD